MNARIVRFVVTAVTAAVVSVMGAGLANASAADQLESRIATATGQQNTHTMAGYLQQMRDYMSAAVSANDVEAVNAAIKNLRPVLGSVATAPVERAAAVLNDRADSQAAQIERDLPGLTLLAPITGLVTSLLTTLLDLLPGVPTPALPDLPAPPDAPAPGADVPAPAVPAVPAVPVVP
jgi:hypothetical protein